ncbi:hypothetical protein BS47DRAFT_725889 [Hydnum rufescens UP504]|uniref:Uncharacterized protein n=1 Tax=Hydnum rufescens UP504 TaxID=1448309 RepID=A0A9P6B1T9_9AGAM|nr:hypothetical protein BS47DRAFT_725889 [Hydnum rufescens UP504]
MARLYLERAGPSIPIDLWLDFRLPPRISDNNPIIPFLLHNIHRCKSLTIQASGYNIVGLFPLTGHVYLLRNLDLRLDGLYPVMGTSPPHLLPYSGLRLHSLSISGFPQAAWPNIEWEWLSHLTLSRVTMLSSHYFETILRQCTNLVSLQCDLSPIEVMPGASPGHIELPRLTLLDMGTCTSFPAFLIHAPQLLHLCIREVAPLLVTDPPLNPELIEFPLLRTIVLSQSPNWAQFLLGFLDACPNLTALELLAREPMADILKEFALNPLGTTLETNMMRNPALIHIRLRIPRQTGTPTLSRKSIWTSLERILHQRPQLSLDFEATSSFTNGLKDLSSVFPGRVRAVDDFEKEPPLSDLY